MEHGKLDAATIEGMIESDDIDTVLMVFPDQQGRFMGKRVTGDFFREDILHGEGAVHACNYLLAVDMEMEPLPGYAYANWDTGYGDLKAVPDMATLRIIPWLEKTALVICDALDEETKADDLAFALALALRPYTSKEARARVSSWRTADIHMLISPPQNRHAKDPNADGSIGPRGGQSCVVVEELVDCPAVA